MSFVSGLLTRCRLGVVEVLRYAVRVAGSLAVLVGPRECVPLQFASARAQFELCKLELCSCTARASCKTAGLCYQHCMRDHIVQPLQKLLFMQHTHLGCIEFVSRIDEHRQWSRLLHGCCAVSLTCVVWQGPRYLTQSKPTSTRTSRILTRQDPKLWPRQRLRRLARLLNISALNVPAMPAVALLACNTFVHSCPASSSKATRATSFTLAFRSLPGVGELPHTIRASPNQEIILPWHIDISSDSVQCQNRLLVCARSAVATATSVGGARTQEFPCKLRCISTEASDGQKQVRYASWAVFETNKMLQRCSAADRCHVAVLHIRTLRATLSAP